MNNPCKICRLSAIEKAACCGCPERLKWEREQKQMRGATQEEEEGITSYVRGISEGTGNNFFNFI